MASSNRHWPSLFKSKPCSNSHHHHPWQQHDVVNSSSLLAGACHKPTYTSSVGEERSPEPKPRWNPRPEQIRILEAIFNSGMVNPPRDEICRIRTQLQEYGQVGDANVFYWFQNRKSRSKHKHRHLQSTRSHPHAVSASSPAAAANSTATAAITGPTSSSTSSSGSAGSDKIQPLVSAGMIEAASAASASPTLSVSQNPYHVSAQLTEFLVEPYYLQGTTQGFGFSAVTGYPEQFGISVGPATWSELAWGQEGSKINGSGVDKLQNPNPNVAAGPVPVSYDGANGAPPVASVGNPGSISEIQAAAAARSTVFINEVAFEVVAGPLNIREAFGDEAILIHSSGQPVLTDQWGLTLLPLQHGDSYYLV